VRRANVVPAIVAFGVFACRKADTAGGAPVPGAPPAAASVSQSSEARFDASERRYDRPLWATSDDYSMRVQARPLSDGRVLVADPLTHQVVMLSPKGEWQSRIAGRGNGALDVEEPTTLIALPADSTLVVDRGHKRMLLVGPDARAHATMRFPPDLADGGGIAGTPAADHIGRLIYRPRPFGTAEHPDVPLLRWDRRISRGDTVARVRAEEIVTTGDPLRYIRTDVVLFSPRDAWGVVPDGGVVVIRAIDYHLDWIAPDGRIRSTKPIPFERVPVSAVERAAQSGFTFASTKPPFDAERAVVATDSQIFVRRHASDRDSIAPYDVLNGDGRVVARAPLPLRRWILAVTSDKVYIARSDDVGSVRIEAFAR
jgi:hypothetical protein